MNRMKYLFQNLFIYSFIALASTPTQAQIIPDNTLGQESSQINTNVLINNVLGDKINGGAARGSNLFHSFSEFNIDNGQRVYFSNPSGVQNILTRVTGGNASFIFGTLGVDGAANLFLMNPNGILFGQNARLDIRGSFVGTTANSIIFPSGVEFSATNFSSPLLTISAPIGLQIGLQPGPIISQAVVRNSQGNAVNGLGVSGSTLALIGGEIALDDSLLYALNGQVQLLAMGGATIGLQVNDSSLGFTVPENAMRSPITFTNGAYIYTNGNSATKLVGGEIELNGSYIDSLDKGAISINATGLGIDNNSFISTFTEGAAKGGDIQIQASDEVKVANGSSIYSSSSNSAIGNAGDISIAARNIAVSGKVNILTLTSSQGNAGNLALNATESVNVNNNSLVSVGTLGNGNTGNLTVRAGNVNVTDGGNLSLSSLGFGSTGDLLIETGTLRIEKGSIDITGSGKSGSIFIQARDAVEIIDSFFLNTSVLPEAKGQAGGITIETQRLNLRDGGVISTRTSNSVNTGNIVIKASDSIKISGTSPSNSFVTSGIFSATAQGSNITQMATGNAGDITIDTPELTLLEGGQVNASSLRSSGNAGNVTVRAKDVELNGFAIASDGIGNSSISARVTASSNTDVRGGTVTVETERLRVSNGANLSTSVLQGRGQAGNLVVRASDSIDITGVGLRRFDGSPASSGLFSELQTGSIGSGGNLSVETGRLSLSNGGQITASTFAQGNAGNISIRAEQIDLRRGETLTTGISTQVSSIANGNAGDININAQKLNAQDRAQIGTSTFGIGNAGNLTIQANVVDIAGSSVFGSSVEPGANGNAGKFDLITDKLTIRQGAIVTSGTDANGNGGNLNIQANDITISGNSLEDNGSAISSTVAETATGRGGDIRINTNSISILDGAALASSTFGKGDAGNIDINAKNVFVDGTDRDGNSSIIGLNTLETANGNAGKLAIDTNFLQVSNGGRISASTRNNGSGGNININADIFKAINGGQVQTSTTSSGQAGNITLNANQVNMTGIDPTYTQRLAQFGADVVRNEGEASGLFANTTEASSGKGGTISVNTPDLNISSSARISVNSRGSGVAGNIDIKANTVRLSDRASIIAETASQDGGSINIDSANLVLLRRNSLISATAAEGGNGGNVDINSKFIVALPKENSNIRANAFKGRGGNINITTQGIFGITSAAFPTPGQSNITASSELGVQGQINITQPDIDPTSGLIELPTEVVDASNQIGQLCPRGELAFRRPLNKFIVTGRGSLPPNPLQPMPGKLGLRQLASLDDETIRGQGRQTGRGGLENYQVATTEIVEAQGFIKAADGTIMLVAQVPNATLSSRPVASVCPIGK